MFRKMRNLHLWIGLITSIIILLESVTGLILAHPELMGAQAKASITERNSQFTSSENQSVAASEQDPTTANNSPSSTNQTATSKNSGDSNTLSSSLQGETQSELTSLRPESSRNHETENNLMGLVKGLHAGRLGNLDITWVIDLAAISMIVLTISGIYLSIGILRGQKKRPIVKESQILNP